jgi:hypothetical protein
MNRQSMLWRFFYVCRPSPAYSHSTTVKAPQINIASTTKQRPLFSQTIFFTFFQNISQALFKPSDE